MRMLLTILDAAFLFLLHFKSVKENTQKWNLVIKILLMPCLILGTYSLYWVVHFQAYCAGNHFF